MRLCQRRIKGKQLKNPKRDATRRDLPSPVETLKGDVLNWPPLAF
jgi:hypothetical protein